MKRFTVLVAFLGALASQAESSRIGPEFEFRAPSHMVSAVASTLLIPGAGYFFPGYVWDRLISQHYIERMYRKHRALCRRLGNCRVERRKSKGLIDWARRGGYRVIYSDGFWFEMIKGPPRGGGHRQAGFPGALDGDRPAGSAGSF